MFFISSSGSQRGTDVGRSFLRIMLWKMNVLSVHLL